MRSLRRAWNCGEVGEAGRAAVEVAAEAALFWLRCAAGMSGRARTVRLCRESVAEPEVADGLRYPARLTWARSRLSTSKPTL